MEGAAQSRVAIHLTFPEPGENVGRIAQVLPHAGLPSVTFSYIVEADLAESADVAAVESHLAKLEPLIEAADAGTIWEVTREGWTQVPNGAQPELPKDLRTHGRVRLAFPGYDQIDEIAFLLADAGLTGVKLYVVIEGSATD